MLSFIFLFLFLVSGSVSLQVSAPSSVTAGQSADVTWTRNSLLDPRTFTLSLRNANGGDDDNQDIPVDSKGTKSGKVTFTPKTTGDFEVEARGNLVPIPLAKSQKLKVNAPATPPPGPPPPVNNSPPPSLPDPSQSPPAKITASSSPPETTTSTSSSTQAREATSLTNTISTNQATSTSTTASVLASSLSSGSATGSTVAIQSFSSSISISASVIQTSQYDTTGSASGIVGQPGATTPPTTTSAATQKSNSGIIAGTIIGVLMFIIVVALLFYMCRRRRRRDTQFYRDMMVRRRSQALLFSQVTTPSVRAATETDFGIDVEKTGAMYDESRVRDQRPPYAYPGYGNTDPVVTVPTSDGPSRSLDIQDAPWTDRQMHIHSKILDLQGKLIAKQSWYGFSDTAEDYDVDDLKAKIAQLEDMMQSAWALGFTDEVPLGYE